MSNMTGIINGAGTVYPSGAYESSSLFVVGSCCSIFSFLWFVDNCSSFFIW